MSNCKFNTNETKFFKYLIWFQQNKEPITAQYSWLAKKFDCSFSSITRRMKKAQDFGLLERLRLDNTKWITLITLKGIEYFEDLQKKPDKKRLPKTALTPTHICTKRLPIPVRKSPPVNIHRTKYHNKYKSNEAIATDFYTYKNVPMIADLPESHEDKEQLFGLYMRDRRAYRMAVNEISNTRGGIINLPAYINTLCKKFKTPPIRRNV